ncbi:arginine--tRNA ligase, partial [Tsukamurella sputi]
FDIDLALSQSSDNPVYYIQYAHARICSILAERAKQAQPFDPQFAAQHLLELTATAEYRLMRTLSSFGEMVATAGRNRAPHLIANYLQELAADVHSYYNAKDESGNTIRILTDNESERGRQDAKLYLLMAAKQILANGLTLLGLSAPTKM